MDGGAEKQHERPKAAWRRPGTAEHIRAVLAVTAVFPALLLLAAAALATHHRLAGEIILWVAFAFVAILGGVDTYTDLFEKEGFWETHDAGGGRGESGGAGNSAARDADGPGASDAAAQDAFDQEHRQ